MLSALISTAVVLVPVLCMICLLVVAYETEQADASKGPPDQFTLDYVGGRWVLFDPEGDPVASSRSKEVMEVLLDLLN